MALLAFIPGCVYFYNSFQLVLDVAGKNDDKRLKEKRNTSLVTFLVQVSRKLIVGVGEESKS